MSGIHLHGAAFLVFLVLAVFLSLRGDPIVQRAPQRRDGGGKVFGTGAPRAVAVERLAHGVQLGGRGRSKPRVPVHLQNGVRPSDAEQSLADPRLAARCQQSGDGIAWRRDGVDGGASLNDGRGAAAPGAREVIIRGFLGAVVAHVLQLLVEALRQMAVECQPQLPDGCVGLPQRLGGIGAPRGEVLHGLLQRLQRLGAPRRSFIEILKCGGVVGLDLAAQLLAAQLVHARDAHALRQFREFISQGRVLPG